MSQEVKFTQEELDSIKELQQEYSILSTSLGQLKLETLLLKNREDKLLEVFNSLTEREQKIIQDLNTKYGVGTLNLDTGTFTPNP